MLSAAGVGTRLCMCGLRCKYHTGGAAAAAGARATAPAANMHNRKGSVELAAGGACTRYGGIEQSENSRDIKP